MTALTFHLIGEYKDSVKEEMIPDLHLIGHLEWMHFLKYGKVQSNRIDDLIPLAAKFNSSKVVVLLDLKMVGVETNYYF